MLKYSLHFIWFIYVQTLANAYGSWATFKLENQFISFLEKEPIAS